MKMKNLLPVLLVVSIAVTLMNVAPVHSSPETTLSVIFPNGTNASVGEYQPGDTFQVEVIVGDVTDLFGYEFVLKYNSSVLTATQIMIGDFLKPIYTEWKKQIDESAGIVWYAASQGSVSHKEYQGVDGSGTLAIIDFTVDSLTPSMLLLSNSKLSDSNGVSIPFTAFIGFFENPPQRIALALDTGFLEEHRWIYSKDEDKLITFTAHIKNVDIGITFARVRFTVLDAEGFPIWETLSEDILVTQQGQQFRISASYSPAQLINHFLYDIVFTLEYIDASGTWSVGHKGSPTGNRLMMIKSFTVEGLP